MVRHHLRHPRADETAHQRSRHHQERRRPRQRPLGRKDHGGGRAVQSGHQVLGDVGGAIIAAGPDRKHAKHEHPQAGAEIAAINRDRQHHCRRMGEAAHVAAGGGAGGEPRADPPGIGEQHGRETEQQRHQRREYPFRGQQQQHGADQCPDNRGERHRNERAVERRQLRTIIDGCEKQAGRQRRGVGGGRHDRRQPGGKQRGEGNDRGPADNRGHDAAGDPGGDEQHAVQEIHCW